MYPSRSLYELYELSNTYLVEAGRWARDLNAGRLELVLSTPRPGGRVILARFGALLAALLDGVLALPPWLVSLSIFYQLRQSDHGGAALGPLDDRDGCGYGPPGAGCGALYPR